MKFRIGKSWTFSASHQLHQMPQGHKCKRLHGHTYSVTLNLEACELDPLNMVLDFGSLDEFGTWVKVVLDHQHLNDLLDLPPTCEVLAHWIFTVWKAKVPELVAVRVSESPETWAEVVE